jgi:hypothetical protein
MFQDAHLSIQFPEWPRCHLTPRPEIRCLQQICLALFCVVYTLSFRIIIHDTGCYAPEPNLLSYVRNITK